MKTYKLKNNLDNQPYAVECDIWTIPFDPANTDYQKFKTDILNDKSKLLDVDGDEMTITKYQEFISNLK